MPSVATSTRKPSRLSPIWSASTKLSSSSTTNTVGWLTRLLGHDCSCGRHARHPPPRRTCCSVATRRRAGRRSTKVLPSPSVDVTTTSPRVVRRHVAHDRRARARCRRWCGCAPDRPGRTARRSGRGRAAGCRHPDRTPMISTHSPCSRGARPAPTSPGRCTSRRSRPGCRPPRPAARRSPDHDQTGRTAGRRGHRPARASRSRCSAALGELGDTVERPADDVGHLHRLADRARLPPRSATAPSGRRSCGSPGRPRRASGARCGAPSPGSVSSTSVSASTDSAPIGVFSSCEMLATKSVRTWSMRRRSEMSSTNTTLPPSGERLRGHVEHHLRWTVELDDLRRWAIAGACDRQVAFDRRVEQHAGVRAVERAPTPVAVVDPPVPVADHDAGRVTVEHIVDPTSPAAIALGRGSRRRSTGATRRPDR